jgi:hypothetical protein
MDDVTAEDEEAEWALFQAAVADDQEPIADVTAAAQELPEDPPSPSATSNPPVKTLDRYEEMKLEQGQWMERLENLKERRALKQSDTKPTYRPVSSLVAVQDIQTIPLKTLQERLLGQAGSDRRTAHPLILIEDPTLSESSDDENAV